MIRFPERRTTTIETRRPMIPIPPTETFNDFLSIVRILRRECPWDREQTHASIAPHLIEEAYEVKESIEEGNDDELKKELGDILLHAVMHSVMAQERGAFDFDDVVRSVSRKLVERHPHVFGDRIVMGSEEVSVNWEQQKMKEGRMSLFEGMPKGMPALQRADRVQDKASKVGFDWEHPEDARAKIDEEIGEFDQAVQQGDQGRVGEELGDLLFSIVNYARFLKVAPEEALHGTTSRFIRRFQHIEARLMEQGKSFGDVDLKEMDLYWEEAKKLE